MRAQVLWDMKLFGEVGVDPTVLGDCGASIFRAKQSKHSPLTACDELS